MVILIGGPANTGKTLLSHRLMGKYGIPYLSIDHLKMGLHRGLDAETFHPLTDTYVLGERLWPIVSGIVKTVIEDHRKMIIEGGYVLPHLVKSFEERYLKEIIAVFIGFSERYISERFEDGIVANLNAIERKGKPDDISVVHNEHEILRKRCVESGVEYIEIDESYEDGMSKVFRFIDEENRARDLRLRSEVI